MATTDTVIMGHDGSTDRKVRVNSGGFLQLADSPYRIRESMKTGYVAITNGTEQSLLAGTTDKYHDLCQISFANASDQLITATLKDDGTTVQIFRLPASNSLNFVFEHPIPSNATGKAWTVDLPDANNSTVYVQALFIEV